MSALTYGSLFTGIGGFDRAFDRNGASCLWQVEKDKNCRTVLARHWPDVERHEDVCNVGRTNLASVDLICGGFPCTNISVAGDRTGLAGDESRLWFEFHRIISELTPRWVLIENVDALLSSNGGDDLATILNGLGKLGYGWAFRVLNAQYFGVPQRRNRVFIVGCLGDSARAASVLFESESVPGYSQSSGEARESATGGAFVSTLQGGNGNRGYRLDAESAGGGQLVVSPAR